MNDILAMVAVLSGYLLCRYAEYRVHKTNYNLMSVGGAEELMPRLMRRYYKVGLIVVPLALVEHFMSGWVPSPLLRTVFLTMMLLAFALRLWAIRTLGPQWSMRCLCNDGFALVTDGPYRWLKHPEYLSRLLEGASLCLFLGAPLAAVLCVILSIRYYASIGNAERRQLESMAQPAPGYR